MNININHYLKLICPVLTAIFFAYFVSTLLLFVLPKRGIDYIDNNSIEQGKINQSSKNKSASALMKNKLLLKAIYKKHNDKSWIVVDNTKTGKTIFLKEGDTIDEATLYKVNVNSAVFTTNEDKFTLKLDVNKKNIQTIIKNGDN